MGRPVRNYQRDRDIYTLHTEEGVSTRELGRRYKMTRVRVWQIITQIRERVDTQRERMAAPTPLAWSVDILPVSPRLRTALRRRLGRHATLRDVLKLPPDPRIYRLGPVMAVEFREFRKEYMRYVNPTSLPTTR
jgi:biotin operon repressor